jgi:hypothetical protein
MRQQLRYQSRPFFVNVSLYHQRNALDELSLNLIFCAVHRKTNQVLLDKLKTLEIDEGTGIVVITLYGFTLFTFLVLVVSVVVLTVCFFNDVFYCDRYELSVLKREGIRGSNVLK